jgi:hypothetical protein
VRRRAWKIAAVVTQIDTQSAPGSPDCGSWSARKCPVYMAGETLYQTELLVLYI